MARFGMAAAVLALMAAPVFAQESTEQLKKELQELRAEVDGLKAQNQTREIPAAAATVNGDAMVADDSPIMTMFKSTKLSGFVDTSYNYSLRGKGTPTNPMNYVGRVFDVRANDFALQAVQINLERLATKDMIVGYHIEVALGQDPAVYNGVGPAVLSFALQEAWLQILAPIGNGLDIRAGKMATLAGYEVIESMNNMNFSRGLLFGFAIPFTNTGVRLNYEFAPQVNATLGLNNGWNAAFDGDSGKTLEAQVEVKPIKDLKIDFTMYAGDESAAPGTVVANGGNGRVLLDLVAEYKMDKLTTALEFDWGVQSHDAHGGASIRNPAWGGVGLFLKYQLMDFFAPSARVEYYSQGFGRGYIEVAGGTPSSRIGAVGVPNRIIEFTLTGEFKIASTLILRLEYRHDDDNLIGNFLAGQRGQDSVAVEAIMPF